jgi:aerobic carbon-monoxide dehydrogenase small subunit
VTEPRQAATAETLHEVSVTVNGRHASAAVPARRLLSDLLRHDLRLTGTHVGCEHGVCGACTVLLDGEPVRSCLILAVSVDGRDLTTIEGLAGEDGTLHPVQAAFHDCHGLQCGFCTPGFVMSICGFLAEQPAPTEDEIREGVAGNLCRCTGYANIVRAVAQAAETFQRSGADPRSRHRPGGPGSEVPAGDAGGEDTS